MAVNSSPLQSDEERMLQSALSTAFTPAPTFPKSEPEPSLEAFEPAAATSPSPATAEPLESSLSVSDDSWKSEYESHVQSWRAQSAEAREKAEKERAKWEELREKEKGSGSSQGGEEVRTGIPAPPPKEPSPVDARDLVTGEQEKPSTHTRHDTGDDSKASSQKWSEVPSDLASSFPSMSFPSPSRPTSPTHSHSHRRQPPPPAHHSTPLTTQQPNAPPPPSATVAIFDASLPIQTRLGALASSLAINCLLPFVNGVMLGFGEIFAKNVVVGWLGWKLPGSGVANVGVKSSGRR